MNIEIPPLMILLVIGVFIGLMIWIGIKAADDMNYIVRHKCRQNAERSRRDREIDDLLRDRGN